MSAGDRTDAQGPSAKDRQVRVFISSTFRDMHAERDHLVTVVFPELRERVEQLGLEFFDVDLRWGVPAKTLDGETANSWEYCRQWIDRVEPFFVCILGQRYGWVPEPQQFRDPTDRQRQEQERRSITDLEVRHAVLDGRRKRRSYFYLRATPVPMPTELAGEYVDPPEYQDRLTQLKTAARQYERPVRDYRCRWMGQGFVEMEEFGRLVLSDLWSGVLRDERYVSKDVWRRVLGGEPDHDSRYTDESIPVPDDIATKIVALAKPPPQDPLDAERQQMDAFAASRLRWFQGRTRELQQLTDFLQFTATDAPRLAVVAAAPGQGKSALLAKFSTLIPVPSTFLIKHFVGATERSATANALVERLLGELDRSGIAWPVDEQKAGEELKRDFNSLCLRLAKRLGDYAGERRVVILLDALNQLTDGHDLVWLAHRLGPSVRVVVSCVEDVKAKAGSPEHRVLHALASRQPAPLRVPLGPLMEDDVRTIVVEYLKEYCKELDREHMDDICRMEQARNPLYLLVMLSELRTLGGNDMNRIVGERIAALARDYPDTVSLFRWVLKRLEVFGAEAVRWWCLYLAHGRVGMASHELADLLACKLGVNAAAAALLIERGLRRYLLRRGAQLDFFHGQLRQAVLEQYGQQVESTLEHCQMADYFTACAKGNDPHKQWETNSVRGFAECVFHVIKAGQHEQAAGLLSNFPFLLHKLRVGLLEGVFEDYDMVRREAPVEVVNEMEAWSDFFREKAHILRRGNDEWPAQKILLQLAIEHADDSPLTNGAERWLAENRCDWLWLRRVGGRPKWAAISTNAAVLEGHTAPIWGTCLLDDGRVLSWSEDHTLRLWDAQTGALLKILEGHTDSVDGAQLLADRRILSWSKDRTLRLWDSEGGELLSTLEGHTDRVSGVKTLEDGRIVSWAGSFDPVLRLWDGQRGRIVGRLAGHTDNVVGVTAIPEGRLLSWSRDKTLRLWDSQSCECLAVLEGHTAGINGAHLLDEGRILTWAGDHTLRLWSGHRGTLLHILEGHSDTIYGVRMFNNGRILSWSRDGTLRLWADTTGTLQHTLAGHKSWVAGAEILANGEILSWSGDKTLRLWDGRTGALLHALQGHTGDVNGGRELSNRRILSWSDDCTLRLWDCQTGELLHTLKGHRFMVDHVEELPNGRMLSWCCNEGIDQYGHMRSGSIDCALRLWDSESGALLRTLEGHTDGVRGARILEDGRILSWSFDHTLRLWETQRSASERPIEKQGERVRGAKVLADGRIITWSADNALRLWDGQTGACLCMMSGHTSAVNGAHVMADGRVLSWSSDGTLRLWDCLTGGCIGILQGHTVGVDGVQVLENGQILSWSAGYSYSASDHSLRLWDGQNGALLHSFEGHTAAIVGVKVRPDGRILSWSKDHTMRMWESHTGALVNTFAGHAGPINGVQFLEGGSILSWSKDGTLRLWDAASARVLRVLDGKAGPVNGAVLLPHGCALPWVVSHLTTEEYDWHHDSRLFLWDLGSGSLLRKLDWHSNYVRGVHVLDDSRVLHWGVDCSGKDEAMGLSDAVTGKCLEEFSVENVWKTHPEFAVYRELYKNPSSFSENHLTRTSRNTIEFRLLQPPRRLACWEAEGKCREPELSPTGIILFRLTHGLLCILTLHHGNRRISLAEATSLLAEKGKREE